MADILAGKARHPPHEIRMLMETVKAAEGRTDFDRGMMEELSDQPAPGDVDLESPGGYTSPPVFGIPEPDDPDPFGVLALEREGLEIREAGTKIRPASTQFEFNPSPTSPVYSKFFRRSMDTTGYRSNRESYMSNRTTRTSTDRATQTAEMGTQTDGNLSPTTSTSPSSGDDSKRIVEEEEKVLVAEPEEVDYTKIDLGEYNHLNRSQEFDGTTVNDSPRQFEESERESTSVETSFTADDDLDDEEPIIFEAASAQATIIPPQAIKVIGGLVDIPKRLPPPPLPPRNLARRSGILMIDVASGQSPSRSPFREGFEEVDVHGVDRKSAEPKRSSGIVRKYAEEIPTKSPKPESSEHNAEDVLKEEHLETISPSVEGSNPLGTTRKDTPALNLPQDEGLQTESEEFHSLPVTPMERPVAVWS